MTPKILIVEDEEDLARGLEINLRQEGYSVLKAATGEAGLKLAIKESPHLIILDLMLPGMNGLDVCRELRQKAFGAARSPPATRCSPACGATTPP